MALHAEPPILWLVLPVGPWGVVIIRRILRNATEGVVSSTYQNVKTYDEHCQQLMWIFLGAPVSVMCDSSLSSPSASKICFGRLCWANSMLPHHALKTCMPEKQGCETVLKIRNQQQRKSMSHDMPDVISPAVTVPVWEVGPDERVDFQQHVCSMCGPARHCSP